MNKLRNEFTLMLCGQPFRMRPTFDALAKMEGETGKGLLELATTLTRRQLTLRQMSSIISAGILGAGDNVPHNLGDMIVQTGPATVYSCLSSWFYSFMTADEDGQQKSEQTEAEQTGKA